MHFRSWVLAGIAFLSLPKKLKKTLVSLPTHASWDARTSRRSMKKPSDGGERLGRPAGKDHWPGRRSLRKTYYPELQHKLDELERFRSLLDESNDCIFLFQVPSFTFVDVNESACRQLDCPREKFFSLSLQDFVPEEDLLRINIWPPSALPRGRTKTPSSPSSTNAQGVRSLQRSPLKSSI